MSGHADRGKDDGDFELEIPFAHVSVSRVPCSGRHETVEIDTLAVVSHFGIARQHAISIGEVRHAEEVMAPTVDAHEIFAGRKEVLGESLFAARYVVASRQTDATTFAAK